MRIRGPALIGIIQAVPDHLTESYEIVGFQVQRRIHEAGNTVQFLDILVALDTLRGVDDDESRHTRFIAKLLKDSEKIAAARAREAPVVADESEVAVAIEKPPVRVELSDVDPGPSPSLTLKSKKIAIHIVPPTRGMALLDALRGEARIRVYVETGANKGHQSASVTLTRKLIQWLSADKKKLNPALVIEFLCNDEDARSKAASIVGGDGKTLDGVKVEVTTFGFFKPVTVNYAFSGAIDNPLVTFARLNAKCLVGLQPIGWAGGPEMVVTSAATSPKYLILTKGSGHTAKEATDTIPFPAVFKRLPFTEPAGAAPPLWKPSNLSDRLVATIMDRALLSHGDSVKPADRIHVCPLYGMGKGQPMEDHGVKVWINVASGLLGLLANKAFQGRIILLNVSKDLGSSSAGRWAAIAQEFAADPGVLVEQTGVTTGRLDAIFEALAGATRLCICTVENDKDQKTMDRVYRESRLPPIFEGQGSLTQVIPMGRPFVKISMRAAADPAWPSDYLPVPGMEAVDVGIQRVSNNIVEDWTKPKFKACAAELAEMFWAMVDPTSEIWAYFQACRVVATDVNFDRLVWAAEALARLLAPPRITGKSGAKDEVVVVHGLSRGPFSPLSAPTKEELAAQARRTRAESLFIISLHKTFDSVDNPGGGDCLYYAFDDGLHHRDRVAAAEIPDRLTRATQHRAAAVAQTIALIQGGQGLTEDMFQGMLLDDLDTLLDVLPRALGRAQDLYDTFFQFARIEIRMGDSERFGDNDPRMVTIARLVAGMMRGAIGRDAELRGWLNQLADGYARGQGRQSEWAGELEYFGLVLANRVNLRVHYVDASQAAVSSGNTHRIADYAYHALAAQHLGRDEAAAAQTIDILHINGGSHYVYGRRRG